MLVRASGFPKMRMDLEHTLYEVPLQSKVLTNGMHRRTTIAPSLAWSADFHFLILSSTSSHDTIHTHISDSRCPDP